MEKFSIKTEIRSGAGAIGSLADLGAKRIFLVTDPFFAKNGTAQKVLDATKAQAVEVFDRVEPDPTVELAAMGTARLREFGADTVIALGGGVSKAGDFLLDAVRKEVAKLVMYKTLPYARIELAKLGPDAGIIGAAMLGL